MTQKEASKAQPGTLVVAQLPPLMLALFQQESSPQIYPGIVLDMTVSGVKLITTKPVQIDSMVILHLELREYKPFAVKGIVKWAKPISTSQKQECFPSPNHLQEIVFTDLTPDVSKAIAAQVYQRLISELGEKDPLEIKSQFLQKRQYLRIPITITMFCRDSQGIPFSIVTEDLSGGGTRFTTNHTLSIGEKVYIQIQLEISSPVITVMGKVIWLRKIDQENYEGGIEFVEVSVHGRTSIVEFLAKNSRKVLDGKTTLSLD